MTRLVLCACAATLLSTACAPLMQAPLVYSSKQQFGINVSTSAAESPAIELSLGYKLLDAAYVPVVVARDCKSESPSDCTSPAYDLKPILGGNTRSDGMEPSEQDLQRVERGYADARVATATAKGEFDAAVKKRDEARAALQSIQSRREGVAQRLGATPDDAMIQAEKTGLDTEYDQANQRLTSYEANRATAEITLKRTEEAEAVAGLAVSAMRRALGGTSKDDKADALSVFGSFDSAGSVAAKPGDVSTGLSLGKVFSTGVAAQILSGGVSEGAAVVATANCIDRGSAAMVGVADGDKAALLAKLFSACERVEQATR